MRKVDQLLAQKMTRKQFLITLGTIFTGLFGLTALSGILSHNEPDTELPPYGMLNYGP